jgi:hypothetical protein
MRKDLLDEFVNSDNFEVLYKNLDRMVSRIEKEQGIE